MTQHKKTAGIWGGITGVAGIAILACMACCIPLIAPVLAWIGVAALGVLAPLGWATLIAVISALALGYTLFLLRRRRNPCNDQGSSGCSTQCRINSASGKDDEAE